MPHNGLLQELEQDVERLVLDATTGIGQGVGSSRPDVGYGQMAYGGGMMGGAMIGSGVMGNGMMGGAMMGSGMMGGNMVGSGMMPVGGMAGGVPGMIYQQPMYAMQGQGIRSPMMGQQMAPGYGPGYIDALYGAPTTMYGPSYGGGMMPTGIQPMYQQPLQQQGQPTVQIGGQPIIQSGGQTVIQPGGQPAYQTGYQSTYQQNYQQPTYRPNDQQLAGQYAQTSQGASQRYQSQPAPAQNYVPITPANLQQSSAAQISTFQAVSNPQRTPSPYQTLAGTGQSSMPNPQALPQAARSQHLLRDRLSSLPPPTSQVQFQIPVPMFHQVPLYLNPQEYFVDYEPTSHKVHDHHHALKALTSSSNHSPQVLSAIVGTYLTAKRGHESNHLATGFGKYSRDEILSYNNSMTKLEALSYSFIKHHGLTPSYWIEAVGPHRRALFAEMYNNNELVRAFCAEMPGGPLELPNLDTYALGTTRTDMTFRPVQVRSSNLNASLSILSQVRTVILVDDSGSMAERGHSSWGSSDWSSSSRFETRWQQARCLLAGIAPLVATHNPYGIDLHFLNRTNFLAGLYTPQAVEAAFDSDRPSGGTPTGQRVNDILDAYMATLRYYRALMPLNLIVITDGEAQDETLLHHAIEEHVTKIVHRGFPAHQFGIEFLQVGDDERATKHLEKLEEEVSRHHRRFQRDVVGVTPTARQVRMDATTLMEICAGGIDARMNSYMRRRGVNV
ncbi:hypothetical protein MMC17_009252 [Xylographa soralifera]|nr:hypothetical protein [Xylographa soralifera]